MNSPFGEVVPMVFRANIASGYEHFPGESFTHYGTPFGLHMADLFSIHLMFSPQFTETVGSLYGLAICPDLCCQQIIMLQYNVWCVCVVSIFMVCFSIYKLVSKQYVGTCVSDNLAASAAEAVQLYDPSVTLVRDQ